MEGDKPEPVMPKITVVKVQKPKKKMKQPMAGLRGRAKLPSELTHDDVEELGDSHVHGEQSDDPESDSNDDDSDKPPKAHPVGRSEKERDLKKEALSVHHLLTHMPKNRYCAACMKAKMQKAHCRKKKGESLGPRPLNFGDQITADHLISKDEASHGIDSQKVAMVILDRATKWIWCDPSAINSTENCIKTEHCG